MPPRVQTQSLESLIAQYRRTNNEAELEIRFHGIDFFIIETILNALVAKELPVDDGEIIQTVNSIMNEESITKRSRGNEKGSLIRQITFIDGVKNKETYIRKWPLATPFRVYNPHALDYNVHLSGESEFDIPFSSDANALIRIKCRSSFKWKLDDNLWRIDITVSKHITGTDAQNSLSENVKRMFRSRGKMTPANMLEKLNLIDNVDHRGFYQYELELEYIGEKDNIKPSDISNASNKILQLAKPEYLEDAVYQSEIYHVASYIIDAPGLLSRFEHELGLKALTSQVRALSRIEYKAIYPPVDYYILDKADGVRALASIREGKLRILADTLIEKTNEDITKSTILDGEYIVKDGVETFYVFDAIVIEDKSFAYVGYENRVEQIPAGVEILRKFNINAIVKPVVHITASTPDGLKEQFNSPLFKKKLYETDGIILVEPGKSYRDTITYKWKSLADTTIDFLAKLVPDSVKNESSYADIKGYDLYFLFVGISPELYQSIGIEKVQGYQEIFPHGVNPAYFPIQFSPSSMPLAYVYYHSGENIDGKIVELRIDDKKSKLETPNWQLVRIRTDRERDQKTQRYYGNDFRSAELTWLNYIDPFDMERLWEGPEPGYFAMPKSALYHAQTAYTSFIKTRRINSMLSHANWVIDAAIGKGQDYNRYVKTGVRHLIGIDKDKGALSELIRRKLTIVKGPKRYQPNSSTTLYIFQHDLGEQNKEIVNKIKSLNGFPEHGADALVCNLAIHYFTKTTADIRNFAEFAQKTVKTNGTLIITSMFGSKIHKLLENTKIGDSWDSYQDGVLKYSIKRIYSEDTLTKTGQKIGVLLPFSNGEYYEEYLVNVDTFVEVFSDYGFSLVDAPSFDKYFEEFRSRNASTYKMLTNDDFEFLSLYGEMIFKKD